jgi:hypothetical protein
MSLLATKYFNVLLVPDNFKETYVNTLNHIHLRSKLQKLLWSVSQKFNEICTSTCIITVNISEDIY